MGSKTSLNRRDLKAFVRFDGSGRVVAGSLVLRRKKPKVGNWQEITAYECCNPTTTAIAYPAGQVSSASDAADACALTLDTVVYLKLATVNVIAVGDIVYNDAAGLNPYDGSATFHRVEAPDGQDWNVNVALNGVVTAVNLCA